MTRDTKVVETVVMDRSIPHNYALWTEFDGNDVWVGTSKGLAWGIGAGYYPRLKARKALNSTPQPAAVTASE